MMKWMILFPKLVLFITTAPIIVIDRLEADQYSVFSYNIPAFCPHLSAKVVFVVAANVP
jgi:hypothetical protein